MPKVSKQEQRKLRKIILSGYGVFLDDAALEDLANKLLELTFVAKKHYLSEYARRSRLEINKNSLP